MPYHEHGMGRTTSYNQRIEGSDRPHPQKLILCCLIRRLTIYYPKGDKRMSARSQTERVVSQLREIILSGKVEPGEHLTEMRYAELLGVSRTPLRLAFSELEKEGLLE